MNKNKIVFFVLFASVFIVMSGLSILSPILPIYAEKLGAEGFLLGLIFSAFSLSRMIFLPVFGNLSDNTGKRKIFISIGLIIFSILSVLYVLSSNVIELILVRFIHGLASGLVVPIAMSYIGDIAPKGREGEYMGTFNISLFLGLAIGPIIGGFFTHIYNINVPFFIMGGFSLLSFILILLFLPPLKKVKTIIKKRNTYKIKHLLSDKIINVLLIYRLLIAISRGAIMVFLPLYSSKIHISTFQIGILISANIIFMSILQRPFGKIADKFNKFFIMIIGSLIVSLTFLILPLFKDFKSLFILNILMSLGGAISMPSAMAILTKIGREKGMGTSMGVFNMAMSLGMIISPLIGGIIMDVLDINWIFYSGGMLSIITVVIFFIFIQTDKEKFNKYAY